MKLLYLATVFLTVIGLLTLRRPLYQALLGSLVMAVLLYRIPLTDVMSCTLNVFQTWDTASILVILYLITYLQRMMESRKQIKLAQEDLNGIFHNRRVNAAGAPLFIGLLPSAAAMVLCSDIVRDATDGYLDPTEQAFLASWFRHIPESTLPTYASVLLMVSLSGGDISLFTLGMVVPVLTLVLLGYLPYLRKLPKDPGTPKSQDRRKDVLHLLQHVWPLLLILVLILVLKMAVVPAVLLTIAAEAVVCRFLPKELLAIIPNAFDTQLLVSTFLVLVLKELIAWSGVLQLLPEALAVLPIPTYAVFALVFFLGGIISGPKGITALGTPMAFAAIPNGGAPLMVLLMCMCHAASQISPTHVCLFVAADQFHVSLGKLIKKTLPFVLIFCALMLGYYQILLLVFNAFP